MLDPLATWLKIKELMREKIPAEEWRLWVQPARLLVALEGGHNYYLSCAWHFLNRRGDMPLLSVLDFALLATWADAGISPVAIERGVDAAFEKYSRKTLDAPGRRINSLRFCEQWVLREAELMKEAAVGSHRAKEFSERLHDRTFLVALPRSGRAIYKAIAREELLNRTSCQVNRDVRIALTVEPDSWQIERLKEKGSCWAEACVA